MKKYLLIMTFLLLSCNSNKVDDNKFYNTYKEILIIRSKEPDTSISNPQVHKYIEKQGYTEETFKQHFFRLAEDPETFAKKIDSLRRYIENNNIIDTNLNK